MIIVSEDGVLRLPDSVLFDSGQQNLKPQGRTNVDHLASALIDILPCYSDGFPKSAACPPSKHKLESVYIEGHTDSDRYSGSGGLKDNWDLSVVRATNTYRSLIEFQPGLSNLCAQKPGRCDPILSVSGYGPQRPVPGGQGTEIERKQQNRRIDLRLIMMTPDSGRAERAVAARLNRQ